MLYLNVRKQVKNQKLASMRLREYICQKCAKITHSIISAEERSSAFEVNFISPENTACPKILAWSRIAAPGSLRMQLVQICKILISLACNICISSDIDQYSSLH